MSSSFRSGEGIMLLIQMLLLQIWTHCFLAASCLSQVATRFYIRLLLPGDGHAVGVNRLRRHSRYWTFLWMKKKILQDFDVGQCCQMVGIFIPKIPIWVCHGMVNVASIWLLLYIFCCHLAHFILISHVLWSVGIFLTVLVCCTKKNLATLMSDRKIDER
jgi:hypothetical protein